MCVNVDHACHNVQLFVLWAKTFVVIALTDHTYVADFVALDLGSTPQLVCPALLVGATSSAGVKCGGVTVTADVVSTRVHPQ